MLSWTLFTFKLSFFICHLSFSAAHVIPSLISLHGAPCIIITLCPAGKLPSLISLHGAPCIIITLCPAGKLRFTVYRNYGCWYSVLPSYFHAPNRHFLNFFRKTFGGFTFICLLCDCSLAEVSLLSGIEVGNLYIEKAYLTLCA